MKIMMFAHDGSLNRGCEAIVRSSTHLIKDRIRGSKVFLASGKPETDRLITKLDGIYDASARKLKRYSYEWFLSAVQYKLFKDESYALGKIHDNIVRHIPEMDVCLSIGGDNYCYGEQPGWYEINKRVKDQGKKLVLWGCSIGNEDMSDRKLEDLKLFDLILARETLTYHMLKSKGLTNVQLCADAAFTMEKEELELPAGWQHGNTIGLNFSPLVMERNVNSQSAVKELIVHILEKTDMTIALTPHVIQAGNNDYLILEKYFEEFKHTGRVILLPNHLNAIQYKGYISRMRMFIGARTHATIAAYSNFVPTMVLGYSVKSKGIAQDIFGEEKLVLGIEEISDARKLKSKFDEMLRDENKIIETLHESIPRIKELSIKAADLLHQLVSE
jgi:colanic acid/amylovoran biosynthesis protein